MSQTDGEIMGVVVLVRHGDRMGFYQSPTTYTATATQITPLGNVSLLSSPEIIMHPIL
jgi:prostatic aicd phosphatase